MSLSSLLINIITIGPDREVYFLPHSILQLAKHFTLVTVCFVETSPSEFFIVQKAKPILEVYHIFFSIVLWAHVKVFER